MSALRQSILEDYDHDYMPDADDTEFSGYGADGENSEDTLEKDILDIAKIEQSLAQMSDAIYAIQAFGMGPATVEILTATRLVSSTSLDAIATESMGFKRGHEAESRLAVEALGESIKEKAKEWSAKILSTVARGAAMIGRTLATIYDRITSFTGFIAGKTWDAVKATGKTIKAHPYKTIIVVLAAVVAMAAILSFVGVSFPALGATGSAITSFMTRLQDMYQAIKWPFGKVTTKAVMNGEAIVATVEGTGVASMTIGQGIMHSTAQAAGWTGAAVKSVLRQTEGVYKSIKAAGSTVWNRVIKPAEKVVSAVGFVPNTIAEKVKERTGSRIASWATEQVVGKAYYAILFKVCVNVYDMIKKIVLGALRMVASSLNALREIFV